MSHGPRMVRTGVSTSFSPQPPPPPPPPPHGGPGPEAAGLVDVGYARSCAAGLKLAQMVSLLIGFICVNSSVWTDYSAYSYFQIVSICDLIMIGIFYLVYIFRVYKMLSCISWPLAEFLHYLIGTVLLFIACIVAASKSYNQSGLIAGAVFGFLATFLCILNMWSSYKVSCVTQSTDAAV
ncbi:CKLF-like MARVEL transmembrane domain-containing protein 7 isoform X2 [Alligator mississippiensis]|nr:CKLF-like MARVEL transmembrane domain-containing protein 7 isoform X2 [Alligator mississippiensis]